MDDHPGEVHCRFNNGVALLTIDRPSTRNAVSPDVIHALGAIIDDIEARIDEVGVVAVRGAGDRVFVSGGDLKALERIRTFEAATEMAQSMRTVLDRVARLPVPTVALLNGDAYGGGAEVAVAFDMRIAAADIRLGFTQVQLGIMPAWGGVERLTTLVGRGQASLLLATGRILTAEQAFGIGLVDDVVPRADFEGHVDDVLSRIAGVPSVPRRAIKALISAVSPGISPDTASLATSQFAQSWVSDEHWSMAEEAARRRRRPP